jgi:CheY-like chemotaxis protein
MVDRRDRLAGMTGTPPSAANASTQRLERTVVSPRPARRQALLYAPPPIAAAPYVTILESEGLDVLVANSMVSAAVLLSNASPALIIALVPVLGDELRELFRKHAPNAEIRAVPGLTPMLEDAVVRPRDAFEFAIRAIVATAGVISAARKTPRERTVRILQLTEGAAAAMRFSDADAAAARVIAALYDVPQALSADESGARTERDDETRRRERDTHRSLLAEFIAGLQSPFPIIVSPSSGDPSQRLPVPLEIVEAAGAFALLQEARIPQAAVALRKLAVSGDLHPIAVEAIIKAAAQETDAAARGRILIIDSDAGARNLLALRLANEGYGTDAAADGRAALEIIRREPPALIISETVLPGMDGFTLLDTLRREGRNIPFVFLSARNDALSMNKGLLLGAADFLAKPINTEVLMTKLQKLLGQALAAAEVSARISLSDVTSASQQHPTVTYAQLEPGVSILGRFRLVADLGEGGMGKVYRARDERLEEDVVIKVMKESLTGDPKTLEHFKREIRLARKISHPAVVRIFDFWEVGPLKFVTMEFLPGTDLANEIAQRGAFPLPVGLRIAAEFFEGLAAAHELGVVHRDIKPHNLFLLSGGRVKILDFGIAQGLDPERPDHTVTTSVIGTPDYMSPEQLVGQKLDARTDIYSAGVMLYELLTGTLPFDDSDRTTAVTSRLHRDPLPPSRYNAKIPAAVDEFILRLLARNRDERWQEARSAATELRNILRSLR